MSNGFGVNVQLPTNLPQFRLSPESQSEKQFTADVLTIGSHALKDCGDQVLLHCGNTLNLLRKKVKPSGHYFTLTVNVTHAPSGPLPSGFHPLSVPFLLWC